jgi:hypothetical protein
MRRTEYSFCTNRCAVNHYFPFWVDGCLLTGFRLLPQYWGRILGSFFTGLYLPQKLVLSPPIERRYKPFQKHVPSYQVKISESCFVWVAPT